MRNTIDTPQSRKQAAESRAAKARERARSRRYERERLSGRPHPVPLNPPLGARPYVGAVREK